jgi:hypothetical protein
MREGQAATRAYVFQQLGMARRTADMLEDGSNVVGIFGAADGINHEAFIASDLHQSHAFILSSDFRTAAGYTQPARATDDDTWGTRGAWLACSASRTSGSWPIPLLVEELDRSWSFALLLVRQVPVAAERALVDIQWVGDVRHTE